MTKEEHIKLFNEMLTMSEEKRCEIINTGIFNSIIQGYLVVTMENMGYSQEAIKKAAYELYHNVFDTVNAGEAKDKAIY